MSITRTVTESVVITQIAETPWIHNKGRTVAGPTFPMAIGPNRKGLVTQTRMELLEASLALNKAASR